ncbi:ABC transporter substrate-binding protein [Hydrococcus rivularis NIES-593]|uniref:ABC transporter substrate-binding protein n=1 Tax=Hydrococcus rivularis NIES-593 TaxID=1921803 RepID=A0A1U7HDB5_9CYAN|nr:ABC transporter substrate-binding protein [Hydrococcus rivularis]OKH21573.1 ABC transporter substrate-binding protein [Hydrococcus rivularis NIES-593]
MVGNKIQIDKKKLVLLAYVAMLSSIGFAILVFGSQGTSDPSKTLSGLSKSLTSQDIQRRMSMGERILVTADNSPDKQAATKAFASRDYTKAVELLNSSLQLNRNDPEAWIYMNNAQAAERGDSIAISAVVPIGGNLNIAKEILRGVAQAQHQINQKGGIGGRLIQVQIANDENDPEVAKKIAEQLVKKRQILAVIGHNASDASIAAAPIYQAGGLVAISPTSSANELSGIGSYLFRTTPSVRVTAETLAQYTVKTARKSKIAICADSTDKASASFKEEFIWAAVAAGGQVTDTSCDFANADFNATEIPSKAISDGADALVLAPSIKKINQAIDVAQANQNRLAMFGNQTMYAFETLKQGQTNVNGMVLAVAWHPAANGDQTYLKNARNLWGGMGNWRMATAYDATEVAIAGLKSEPKRDALQKALSNSGFSFKGATGEIRFLPSGDRYGTAVLVKIQPGKTSDTGYDFAILKPAVSGQLPVNR